MYGKGITERKKYGYFGRKELYDTALKEVTELAVDVIEQCFDFANRNDYDKEWVLDRFQEQFSRAKKDFLNR